jgi:spore coat protein U-like protein
MTKELNKNKSVFVKNSKMTLAKSTTAFTCLVGLFIVSSDPAAAVATTTGTLVASTSVGAACTISAGAMGFAAYTGAATITQTSVVTVDCSTGSNYTISFNDTANGSGEYILQNTTTNTNNTGHQLLATFTNGLSAMTSGAATITGTGTGTSAAAGTITGSIVSGQTGKSAGSYSKTITLNLVY